MNDNMTMTGQRIAAFDKANGGREASVQSESGWILYRNGAMRESEPMGALIRPPSDPYELAVNILKFHQCRLQRATKAFYDLKEALSLQTGGDPGTEEAIARLKALKASVDTYTKDVDIATRAVNNTERGQAIQGHKDSQVEQRQRIAAHKSRVSAIRLHADSAEE